MKKTPLSGWLYQAHMFLIIMIACFDANANPFEHFGYPPASKPNILFILADDLGYADVGFNGCKDIATPNLDALAASGVKFTNGYVSASVCSPSRAGLLTARYQQRFGHEHNAEGPDGLPLTETTIADRLKEASYKTGIIGKWHLGIPPQYLAYDNNYAAQKASLKKQLMDIKEIQSRKRITANK